MKTSAKKALVVIGSPRENGNSAALAHRAADGIRDSGAAVEVVYLQRMDIRPCTACDSCQGDVQSLCVIDDDMRGLYPKLREADGLVIASPVYWFTVSAQTKLFMDRCFALPAYGQDAFAGKRIAIAMSYGDADPFASGCVNALRTFQDAFRYAGAKIVGMVYGSAFGAGEIRANESLMKAAEDLGKKIGRPSNC